AMTNRRPANVNARKGSLGGCGSLMRVPAQSGPSLCRRPYQSSRRFCVLQRFVASGVAQHLRLSAQDILVNKGCAENRADDQKPSCKDHLEVVGTSERSLISNRGDKFLRALAALTSIFGKRGFLGQIINSGFLNDRVGTLAVEQLFEITGFVVRGPVLPAFP